MSQQRTLLDEEARQILNALGVQNQDPHPMQLIGNGIFSIQVGSIDAPNGTMEPQWIEFHHQAQGVVVSPRGQACPMPRRAFAVLLDALSFFATRADELQGVIAFQVPDSRDWYFCIFGSQGQSGAYADVHAEWHEGDAYVLSKTPEVRSVGMGCPPGSDYYMGMVRPILLVPKEDAAADVYALHLPLCNPSDHGSLAPEIHRKSGNIEGFVLVPTITPPRRVWGG